MKYVLAASLIAASLFASCRTVGTKESSSEVNGAGTGGKKLLPPPAGTIDNDLDVAAVVKYMNMIRQKFYVDHTGITVTPGETAPDINDAISCLGNNPAYWSTLVQHFYCLHTSYKRVIPNVRGCFSNLANGSQVNGRGFYPEIFDYCTYQEYDAVLGKRPVFDVKEIVANKMAGKKVGVMKYMTAEEEEIFKYVVYTWYNPFAFKAAQQQQVLDQFWGPGKYTVQTQGKANHPNYATILPFMKTVDANQGEVPWPGLGSGLPTAVPSTSVPTPVSVPTPIVTPVSATGTLQSGWYTTNGTKCELNVSSVIAASGGGTSGFTLQTGGQNCQQAATSIFKNAVPISGCVGNSCTVTLGGATGRIVVANPRAFQVVTPQGSVTWTFNRP